MLVVQISALCYIEIQTHVSALMTNILLWHHKDYPEVIHIADHLKEKGLDITTYHHKPESTTSFKDDNFDVIITVGGDGTMLQAGKYALIHDLPMIGIHLGKLGFLADTLPTELKQLDAMLEGAYIEERRATLMANDQYAINDVVMHRGNATQLLNATLSINDEDICSYHADGVIVASPTGSTAYGLSCGGPIIDPSMNSMLIMPINPHRLTSRPLIVPGDTKIHLRPTQTCTWAIDGQHFDAEELNVTLSKQTLRLRHPKGFAYYRHLRQKLHWESSIHASSTAH